MFRQTRTGTTRSAAASSKSPTRTRTSSRSSYRSTPLPAFPADREATMTVIDLTENLDDIRSRYPDYWRSDEAQREVQTLWGGADCNDCGVFERDETIRVDIDCQ